MAQVALRRETLQYGPLLFLEELSITINAQIIKRLRVLRQGDFVLPRYDKNVAWLEIVLDNLLTMS
jgi:hypothetical protein